MVSLSSRKWTTYGGGLGDLRSHLLKAAALVARMEVRIVAGSFILRNLEGRKWNGYWRSSLNQNGRSLLYSFGLYPAASTSVSSGETQSPKFN